MKCLTAIAAMTLAYGSGTADSVTFQYAFKKGQTIRYHIEVQTNIGIEAQSTFDTSMHVDETTDDGGATLTTKLEGGRMNMHGMKIKMPGMGKEVSVTVTKYGKAMEVGDKAKGMTIAVQEFPDHAISVGQSWDGTIRTAGGKSNFEVNAHFTLESVKSVDGHRMAHVLVTDEGSTGSGKSSMTIHASGYMDWDATDNLVKHVHIEGTQELGGGKMSGPFTSDQTLVEGDKG